MKKIGIQLKDSNNNEIYPNPFPVGAIYISVDSRNPSQIFGGTWEQIKDRFLLCAGNTYKAGSTGGEASHTLTTSEIPSHNHSGSTSSSGAHSHTLRYGSSDGSGVNISVSGTTYTVLDLTWRWTTSGWVSNVFTTYEGSHTHSFTTNNTGGSGAHNNMPPYLTVYAWKRIA